MKIRQKLLFFFIITAAFFPVLTVKAEGFPAGTGVCAFTEAPAFDANIEYTSQGFLVRGEFTEFSSDISQIQPLCSLDGETYEACGVNWDLPWPDDDENALKKLQRQVCLYSNQEPLKSYLGEKLDRFYLKLRIAKENGTSYKTRAALIDRGGPKPVPEGFTPAARFDSSIYVLEYRPFCHYGRYQLTISENATPEDVSSFLPDTLPVEVQFQKENDIPSFTKGVVNCPVTWKPISLPKLAAGETVTLADAAEEIVVPEGSPVTTPTGIFRLNEPLGLNTDEIRLVLNVIAEDENPAGALAAENTGLEIVFHLKPTGATAIQAYTLSQGETKWTKIPGLSLLNAVNAQPSTASSGYSPVLGRDQEPYRSYQKEIESGGTPDPFYIGLTIEGGVYGGKQLILAWPDTYDLPLSLPKLGGSGGNEANAGSDNKHDSTPEGQRPDLPQHSKDSAEVNELPEDLLQNSKNTRLASPATGSRPKKNLTVKPIAPSKENEPEKTNPAQDGTNANAPGATKTPERNGSQTEADDEKSDAPPEAEPDEKDAAQTKAAADSNDNGLKEMPNRSAANESPWAPLLLAAAAAGLGTASAIRKITAGQTLRVLQKLHYKRGSLARR